MKIKPEHIIYTDEQVANMAVLIVEDRDPNALSIQLNHDTGQLIAVVRTSSPEEDLEDLRESLTMIRIDWLGALGYESVRLLALELGYLKDA